MPDKDICFVCEAQISGSEKSREFVGSGRRIIVHQDCLVLFGELVRASFQEGERSERPSGTTDFSTLPALSRTETSEHKALQTILGWAANHHPMGGLTPKEIQGLFEDQYRWKLSNPSARLGELVERKQVRRKREGKEYRYFSL